MSAAIPFLPPSRGDQPELDRVPGAPHPREMLALLGQDTAEAGFLEGYHAGRLHHAFLLCGPEGCGKATFAYRAARFLLGEAERAPGGGMFGAPPPTSLAIGAASRTAGLVAGEAHPDLAVLKRGFDAKTKKFRSEINIEDTRNALTLFEKTAAFGGWRVIIIDSADDLNNASANAILKTLEEPPERAVFLLVAHQPQRLLATIRSRCRRLDFSPLPAADIAALLDAFAPQNPDPAQRSAVLGRANGSIRRAMRLMDVKTMAYIEAIEAALAALPDRRSGEIDRICEATRTGPPGEQALADLLDVVEIWLAARLHALVAHGNGMNGAGMYGKGLKAARSRADIGVQWAKITAQAGRVEALNLDRRAFVVNLFEDLAALAA